MGKIGSEVSFGLSWAATDFCVQGKRFIASELTARVVFLLIGDRVYNSSSRNFVQIVARSTKKLT